MFFDKQNMGISLKKPRLPEKGKMTTFFITPSLRDRVESRRLELGLSYSAFLRNAIEAELAR